MVEWWNGLWEYFQPFEGIIQLLIIIVLSFVILSLILRSIKKHLLKKVKSKKQISNVSVFIDLMKYIFALIFLLIVVFAYYDSWGELGFIAGLLTVALGWALQKPISGVFAWIIIITRKPFRIGDRICINDIKGDITEISLTHIVLDEVGGTIDGEEGSGRTIIIPTSSIFEVEIINFTQRNDYILDEVNVSITYESDLNKAEKILIKSVNSIMMSYWEKFPKRIEKNPHIRLKFLPSGIDVIVRYNTIALSRNKISTDIRREIHKLIMKSDSVEFAYPHSEILLRNKK